MQLPKVFVGGDLSPRYYNFRDKENHTLEIYYFVLKFGLSRIPLRLILTALGFNSAEPLSDTVQNNLPSKFISSDSFSHALGKLLVCHFNWLLMLYCLLGVFVFY